MSENSQNINLQNVLAIAGCIALLIGLFGGGVKAKEITIPKLSFLARFFSSLIGVALIGTTIWLPIALQPSQQPSQQPTSLPSSETDPAPSEPPITSLPVTEPPEIPPATEPPATEVPTLPPDDFSDNSSPSAVMAGERLTVFARSTDGSPSMHSISMGKDGLLRLRHTSSYLPFWQLRSSAERSSELVFSQHGSALWLYCGLSGC